MISGNRIYLSCLYVYNKIDQISLEEVNRIARAPYSVVVSCNMKLNLDFLLETLWEYLSFIRVYTKKPGQPPDFNDCLILRRGVTVEHVCHSIHRTLAAVVKYALVWVNNALVSDIDWQYKTDTICFVFLNRELALNSIRKESACITSCTMKMYVVLALRHLSQNLIIFLTNSLFISFKGNPNCEEVKILL